MDDESDSSGDAESTDDGEDSDGDDAGGVGNVAAAPSPSPSQGHRGRRGGPDDPPNTVVHEREPRTKRARDEVQGISGSTRLEAKRQQA